MSRGWWVCDLCGQWFWVDDEHRCDIDWDELDRENERAWRRLECLRPPSRPVPEGERLEAGFRIAEEAA